MDLKARVMSGLRWGVAMRLISHIFMGHDHLGDAAAFSVRLDAGCVWYAT